MRILALAVVIMLVPGVASAAKKKKPPKETSAPADDGKKDDPATPAPAPAPAPMVEQYESFSTHGGATLNDEAGLRIDVFGGNHTFGDGYGYGGLDALYYVGGTGKNVDFGVGLRFGAYPLAVAPQLEVRWRVVKHDWFHFGLYLGASLPLSFRGMFGNFTYAVQAEPGLLFSFFVKTHIEIFLNITVPGTMLFTGLYIPVPQIGFTGRVGFIYNFMKPGIGLMFAPEVTPGFYAPFGAPTVVGNIANSRVAAGFLVAFNVKVGVQVRF